MCPNLNLSLSCPTLPMNKSQSFVALCQKGKSFEAVGKSMQDSPNLTLNNAHHEIVSFTKLSKNLMNLP